MKINKSCNTEEMLVEDIKKATCQDKQKNVHIDKVCTKCEEMKEACGHLLGEFKEMECYYLHVREKEVVEMENEKNYVVMLHCINTNERKAQRLRCKELEDEHDKFKDKAVDKVKLACDTVIASEENYNHLLKDHNDCISSCNNLRNRCENIISMREQKECRRNRLRC